MLDIEGPTENSLNLSSCGVLEQYLFWTSKTTNEDVPTEFKPETRLLTSILQRKLIFVGHIIRDEESVNKTLVLDTVYGTRGRGRPKTRYSDEIVKVCGSMQEANQLAKDRGGWGRLMKGVST